MPDINQSSAATGTPDLSDLDTPARVARRSAAPARCEQEGTHVQLRRLLAVQLQNGGISQGTAAAVMRLMEVGSVDDREAGCDFEI